MMWVLVCLLVIMALDMLFSAVQPEKRYNRVRTTYDITLTRISGIIYAAVLVVAIVVVMNR